MAGNVPINVTLRGLYVTIVAMEKNNKYYIFWICV
jgi:hypothetical protein